MLIHYIIIINVDLHNYNACLISLSQLSSVVEVFDCQSEVWVQRSTAGKPPKGLYNCAYTHIGKSI